MSNEFELEKQLAEMKNAFHEADMLRGKHLCELAELREAAGKIKPAFDSKTADGRCYFVEVTVVDDLTALLKQEGG